MSDERRVSERLVGRLTAAGHLQTLWYPPFETGEIDLFQLGEVSRWRASLVDPVPDGPGWTATLADGTVLGPFPTRMEALTAEVSYLETRLLAGEPVLVGSPLVVNARPKVKKEK